MQEIGKNLPKLIGEQCRILYLSDKRNQVILGVAGSGKSVEAVYRAAWLSKAHPDEKILLLTVNNQVNGILKKWLKSLNFTKNIIIDTIYHYFKFLLNNYKIDNYNKDDYYLGEPKCNTNYNSIPQLVATNSFQEKQIIQKVIVESKRRFSKSTLWNKNDVTAFIRDEIYWMQRMNITEKNQYLENPRIGRGNTRISAQQKETMFEIFKLYRQIRKELYQKGFNFNDIYPLIKHVCNIPEDKKPRYIIIDEVQDVTPSMFDGLNAIIKEKGYWNVFGDLSQNIFGEQISWKKLGIKTNKVYRLRHNYRNTKQIGELAKSILDNVLFFDDMSNASDPNYHIEPEISVLNGDKPILCNIKFKAFLLKKLKRFIKNGTTAVICMNYRDINIVRNILNQNNIQFESNINNDISNKVYLNNINRVKGLEFDNVIVYGIDDAPMGIDETKIDNNGCIVKSLGTDEQVIVARKIYVALTRARKNLILVYHNNSLSFMFKKTDDLLNRIVD